MTARRFLALILALLFAATCLAPVFADDAAPKKKKAKKKDEYENSKYKSYKVLADEPRTYRFDANGDPIPTDEEKKRLKKKDKKKKKSDDDEVAAPACAETETCQDDGEPAEKKKRVSSEGSDF